MFDIKSYMISWLEWPHSDLKASTSLENTVHLQDNNAKIVIKHTKILLSEYTKFASS